MFLVAFFSRCYWMIGAVLGGVLGQLIPWDMKGIDFCMTALFVIIFIDQWEKTDKHTPALAGCGIGIICFAYLWSFQFYASGIGIDIFQKLLQRGIGINIFNDTIISHMVHL